MSPIVRLTAAQALVRYLSLQWSERDGRRRRVVPGIFGIFGHGNVCGLGPALEEDAGRELRFHQPKNEQAMVHAAIGFARASNLLSTMACTASIGPGSTNLLTGAATATVNRVPVLLLPSDTFVGGQVALEALHQITGLCAPATLGTAHVYDLRTMQLTREPVPRVAGCEVCGG
jgi:3D-(3,5/4)-trihydroxycyclohexane-1,2-dione acylhydrolase (decyclizing)